MDKTTAITVIALFAIISFSVFGTVWMINNKATPVSPTVVVPAAPPVMPTVSPTVVVTVTPVVLPTATVVVPAAPPKQASVSMSDIFGETCNRNILNEEEAIKALNFFDSNNKTLNSENIAKAEEIVDNQLTQQLQERRKKVTFVPGKVIKQMLISTGNGNMLMRDVNASSLPNTYTAYRLWVDDPTTRNGKIYVIAVYNCDDKLISLMQVVGGVTQKINTNEPSDSGVSNGNDGNDDGGDEEVGSPSEAKV